MSRLYWTTADREVEVKGWEAHWVHAIPRLVAEGVWRLDSLASSMNDARLDRLIGMLSRPESLREQLARARSARSADAFVEWQRFQQVLRTRLCSGSLFNDYVEIGGRRVDINDLMHNTALAVGAPYIQFLTKLSGYMEIHAFIEPEHRGWAAQMILEGREKKLLRDDAGWEQVVDLLQADATHPGPVVTHYSVTDSFPNEHVAEWSPPEGADDDAWYELPDEQKWELALAGIRKKPELSLSPDSVGYYYFSTKVTIMDVLAEMAKVGAE